MDFKKILKDGKLNRGFSLEGFLAELSCLDPQYIKENTNILNFIISLILEKETLEDSIRQLLLTLRFDMLQWLIEQYDGISVMKTGDYNFNEGIFVSDKGKLTEPYSVHEHYYIEDNITLLTEWYYTGANGLKYREVIFPNGYRDPGFLLENSLLTERQENMEKLSKCEDLFSV